MTSPARQAEADRVELVYYWALNRLGNALAADSLELWQTVPASSRAATSGAGWLVRVLRLLFGFRKEAQQLGLAYYRLVRALRTGYAPATGDEQSGSTVSLEALRTAFESVVDNIERETSDTPAIDLPGDEAPTAGDSPAPDGIDGEDDEIELEDLGDIEQLIEQLDEDAEIEAFDFLDREGIQYLTNQLDDGEDPDRAFNKAAGSQAATAMRIMMNAARGLTYNLADSDLRIQGWIRYSQTGSPCAFCAMLLSRGPVLYATRASALAKTNDDGNRVIGADGEVADQNKYHPRCRCVAVPVFIASQYNSPLFDLNRRYAQLWADNIKGKVGGGDALNAWRTFLRRQLQEADALEAAA